MRAVSIAMVATVVPGTLAFLVYKHYGDTPTDIHNAEHMRVLAMSACVGLLCGLFVMCARKF